MTLQPQYDVAIAGGGLAGLAASIELAAMGHSVVLFEKEKFPFHKVCGEYVSMESWNYLEKLGLNLQGMHLPKINTLLLTAPGGRSFTMHLPQGGFGISRFQLDHALARIAREKGVHLVEETKVEDMAFVESGFQVQFQSRHHAEKNTRAKLCCSATGKRSNLDVKWNRDFLSAQDKRLQNYVAVKYHIRTTWPDNLIGLHNFENGYCGISKIEEDRYCLCYMTRSENLKNAGNHIGRMEEHVLYHNPHLKKIFTASEFCSGFPVTISQISFSKKTQVENHLLMLGDAAGMITPLCGNGMSIALHTAKIGSGLMHEFLSGRLSREEMEDAYTASWKHNFSGRLKTGRRIQGFFGSTRLSELFVQVFKTLPFLRRPLVKMTHGKPF
jgi:menaquinone-9 beta-reductase